MAFYRANLENPIPALNLKEMVLPTPMLTAVARA
jgi:hypothetical protein